MPKHRADRQLTHDNWDEEEETVEPGQFVQASEDVLKQRKIKRAIRKGGNSSTSTGASSGAFSGFGGFGSINSDSLFTCNKASHTNGSTTGAASAALKIFEPSTATAEKSKNGVNKKGDKTGYLKQLRSLNESVVAWIKQHVDKNPYCMLSPIFNDYEKHLSEIEKKYPKKGVEENEEQKENPKENDTKSEDDKQPKSPDKPTGLFSVPTSTTEPTKTSPFSAFKFGTVTQSNFKPSFSFGGVSGTGATTTTDKSNTGAQAEGEEGEEYVPPKAEVRTIVEDGAVYSKRCKLFYQKDGAWVEKGIGNVHLKEVGDKSQLVVRADTNLGNVLLNILITKSLPTQRQGKNNVSLMCVPNPPLDPKKEGDNTAVPLLIRVKTGEDADELLKKINDLKK